MISDQYDGVGLKLSISPLLYAGTIPICTRTLVFLGLAYVFLLNDLRVPWILSGTLLWSTKVCRVIL